MSARWTDAPAGESEPNRKPQTCEERYTDSLVRQLREELAYERARIEVLCKHQDDLIERMARLEKTVNGPRSAVNRYR